MNDKQQVIDALKKKATGFIAEEVTEEYLDDGEEIKLTKKKVTKKYVPPDCTAIKMLIESESEKPIEKMTDEELEKEKQRLLTLLQGENVNK